MSVISDSQPTFDFNISVDDKSVEKMKLLAKEEKKGIIQIWLKAGYKST